MRPVKIWAWSQVSFLGEIVRYQDFFCVVTLPANLDNDEGNVKIIFEKTLNVQNPFLAGFFAVIARLEAPDN